MANALMVSSSFLPGRGGIESYLAELCGALSPNVAVLAAAERDGKPLPPDLPYPTTGFKGAMLWPSKAIADAIVGAAAEHDTDRVLFGTPWPLVLLGPSLAKKGLRYAVIVHGAELLVPAALPFVRARLRRALQGADLLLPVSDFTAGRVRSLTGKETPTLSLLRARVDLNRFNPSRGMDVGTALGLAKDAQIVLCFGRLVTRKGVHRLVKALRLIEEQVPSVVLVIAGTGPQEKRLRKLARGRSNIRFTGRVSDDDAPGLFAAADVFALPVADRWFGLEIEGLGVVLLEAAACATACVTGRSGGTPEAVIDGETGYVVDATDEAQLAGAITHLLQDPIERERMGVLGRMHVARSFSRTALAPDLLEWLDYS